MYYLGRRSSAKYYLCMPQSVLHPRQCPTEEMKNRHSRERLLGQAEMRPDQEIAFQGIASVPRSEIVR